MYTFKMKLSTVLGTWKIGCVFTFMNILGTGVLMNKKSSKELDKTYIKLLF